MFEDLGVQMNRHSTLVSYLEKLVWLLTGNLAHPRRPVRDVELGNLLRMSRAELDATHGAGVAGRRRAAHRRARSRAT